MAAPRYLLDGDAPGRTTILLAHGAGAAMDAGIMPALAQGLARRGLRVARFELRYMAARHIGGPKRPPPRIDQLQDEYRAAVAGLPRDGPLIIGGKSMGGRVASHVADALFVSGNIAGLVCLGYPFHPRGKPEVLRAAHLAELQTPALICQGTRDPFGTRDEVACYALSARIELAWQDDGDHDLKPRKSVVGRTHAEQLEIATDAISAWALRTISN